MTEKLDFNASIDEGKYFGLSRDSLIEIINSQTRTIVELRDKVERYNESADGWWCLRCDTINGRGNIVCRKCKTPKP